MQNRLVSRHAGAGAALIALLTFIGSANAQTLPASAFATYDPSTAGSIQPGLFSLYAVPVDSLSPTQINVGDSEVGKKQADWNLITNTTALQSTLLQTIEPVVIGPGGQLYQINGHHSFLSLQNSIWGGANDPTVYVNVVANYSTDTPAQFVADLEAAQQIYPLDNGVVQTVTPVAGNPLSPLPTSLQGLTNDPYRGLEFHVLKNKYPGGAGTGFDKTATPFSDFVWANAYRDANGGNGLPYLSPADVNAAALFSETSAAVTSLPGIGAITVGQLPGFTPSTNFTISTTISNATLSTGALDGNGTFTGLNGYSIGGLTIQPHEPGFVMQLGNTVTLSGSNTYTGGTTLFSGTLVANSDAALGAAPIAGSIDPNNVAASVQALNGIVFDSLTEGNATLRFGTGFTSTSRDIAVGQEAATIDMNGNNVTLNGQLASFSLGESGVAPLSINDNKGTGSLTLTANSPLFHGNIVLTSGTLLVSSDAQLGATTGPAYEIGELDLDGGTFKPTGGSFSSVRNVIVTSSSTYDTNGQSSSFSGTLSDTQRALTIMNGGTAAGSVAFGSFEVGATVPLTIAAGSGPATTSVTFTNGITRDPNATLLLSPKSGALGTTEKVFSSGASTTVTNGIVAPWIVLDTGGSASSNPYNFVTYGTNGYTATTAFQSSGGSITTDTSSYALNLKNGKTDTISSGKTLTLGDGTDPAGLIMNGSAAINGGTLAFRGSEGVIFAKSTNTIGSVISGSNGFTLAGSGTLVLTTAATNTGAIAIDSGTLQLNATNAVAASSGITLMDTKSKPSAAILDITSDNAIASLNSVGNNSTVTLTGSGVHLTIGDSRNLDSTLLSTINDSGSTAIAGELTKDGNGLLDLSQGKSGAVSLNAGSTIVVNGGELRIASNTLKNNNQITLAAGTELQFDQGGGGAFSAPITGQGAVHLMSGTLELTGTSNTWSGNTLLEVGSVLDATTSSLSASTQNVINAGGTLVLDQNFDGNFTAVMSDGQAAGQGATLSGSFVKDDSSGGNTGNVTITKAQTYTGETSVEAGTLTLGTTDTVATSSGVDLGRVGGGATANLALNASNTVQALSSEAGDTTGVQLNGHTLTVSGTTLVNAGAMFTISGAGNVAAGSVNNAGTFTLRHATASFSGTFTNSGSYISDPSTQTFATLLTTSTGSIQASAGDTYQVGGDFLNHSTQNTIWNTMSATLEFITGAGDTLSHILQLTGVNGGRYASANNFAWGALEIDAGNSLQLQDGLTGDPDVAMYVGDIVGAIIDGDTVTNISGNGYDIYYDPNLAANAYLDGRSYALSDGGELIAAPEPSTLALLLPAIAGGICMVRRRTVRPAARR